MTDIVMLKRALTEKTADVCRHLYPDGEFIGPEFVVDPGTGKLKVALRGQKQGLWSHFGGDGGGDLIDLWMRAKGETLPTAMGDIQRWLGIEAPRFHKSAERSWVRPKKPPAKRPRDLVRDYLTEDRNLPDSILDLYKIGEQGRNIVFPFLWGDELIMAKVREAVDGAKPKPTEAGCEKILFGWQAIPENARSVTITEGEIDAMSVAAYGYPALSVPYGGGGGAKQDWIESEYDNLARFETIYLALDTDAEGEKATAEIARRLGHHRCKVVKLPRKDANECLVDGVAKSAIDACFEGAQTIDPEGLRKPGRYLSRVVELFWPGTEREGYTLPFPDPGPKLQFRPGEMTIWSGATGSGKSQVLCHAMVHWIADGGRVCLASLEMAPAQSLRRMVKQAANTDRPTVAMIEQTLAWLDQGLLLFDMVGKAGIDRLIEIFDYARARYGCDLFVIDSLMRLGIASDDYTGQEAAVFKLVSWAVANRVHLHLVAHSRKSDGRHHGVPDTDDVKGASEITNNAFNVVIVWRNKAREDMEALGEPTNPVELDAYREMMAKPGVILNVTKQRNGDWEGKVYLRFDRRNYQYRGMRDSNQGVSYVQAPVAA